jgi:hypothetical protein
MAKKEEKIPLKKGKAQFMLVGEAKINDYTFSMDKESNSSDWVYNQMNLGVDCGNGNVIYADLMGGYGSERDNVIYVHGVKEKDGRTVEDYENRFTIDWDDRFDESILETIADSCFIKVGIEKDTKDKTFTKKFLSAYDAIKYIKENLENGTVVNVKGSLKYQCYNDNVYAKKEINSIFLSKATNDDYKAVFTQTLLIDKDAVGKVDKEKAIFPISAYVVDYVGKYEGQEIKQNVAFVKSFELEIDKNKPENTKKLIEKMFTPKKKGSLVEVTVEGNIVEGASVVNITLDDLPEDIRELIELNVLTEEEALNKCAIGGNKEKRMIIKKPLITFEGEGDEKKPIIAINKDKYSENDLIFLSQFVDSDNSEDDEASFDIDEKSDKDSDDLDFLALLDEE